MTHTRRERPGRLYEIRAKAKLSQARLAVYAGVSPATIAALERLDGPKLRRVTLGELVRLADALGGNVTPLDLVPGLAVSANRYRRKHAPHPAAVRRAEGAPGPDERHPSPQDEPIA